jgi:hypothetical protein
MHNKVAARQIKNQILYGALREKQAKLSMRDIQDAMEMQRELNTGSAEDRIGSVIEANRRAGALMGTAGGALGGAGLAAGLLMNTVPPPGTPAKARALLALTALGGAGAGGLVGNLTGRGAGILSGAVDGGLSAIPGLRDISDYLSQPILGD